MRKRKSVKHVRAFAWLVIASLGITSIAPAFTAFAAEESVRISVSSIEDRDSDEDSDSEGSGSHDPSAGTENGGSTSGTSDTGDKTEGFEGSPDDAGDSKDSGESDGTEDTAEDSGESNDKENTTENFGDPCDKENTAADAEEADDDREDTESPDDASVNEGAAGTDPEIDDKVNGDDSTDNSSEDDPENMSGNKPAESDGVKEDGVVKDEVTDKKEAGEDKKEADEDDEFTDEAECDLDPDILLTASVSDADKAVCMVGDDYYETIEKAVDAIGNGTDTITLITDVFLKETLQITEGRINFDLGGFTLTGVVYVTGGSEVTVENGTIDSEENYWKVYASGYDDHPTRFTLAENAKIEAEKYGLLLCGVTGSSDNNGTGFVVTIDGEVGTSDPSSSGIWLQGNMQKTSARVCDLIVNGTVTSGEENGAALAINGWGNVTVNEGAELYGATGIEIRSGNLIVNGGSIAGTADTYASWANSNGSSTRGAGIAVNEHKTDLPVTVGIKDGEISGYYALVHDNTEKVTDKISLSITGGRFMGNNDECAILVNDFIGEEGTYSVMGGTFVDRLGDRSDIGRYLTSAYRQDEEGRVVPVKPAFSVGDNSYASFEDVVSAVQGAENPTIKAEDDIQDFEAVTIAEDQKLNLDLDGHDLSIKDSSDEGFRNKGSLAISGHGTVSCDNIAITNDGGALSISQDVTVISQNGNAIANHNGDLEVEGTVISEGSSAILSTAGTVRLKEAGVTGKTAIEISGGTVDIEGGIYTGNGGYAVSVSDTPQNGRSDAGVYATIKGGTFVTDGNECIANNTRYEEKPVLVYCGNFSDPTALEKFLASDKTGIAEKDGSYEVYTYDIEDIKETSCTEDGYASYTCAVCGMVYTFNEEKAYGHDWSNWETTSEPTPDKDGEMSRECNRCGLKETVTIDRTGYKLDISFLDNDGHTADGVRFEIHDKAGSKVGETYTQSAEIYLPAGDYTVVIIDSNGYSFNFTSLDITLDKDYPVTIMGTFNKDSGEDETPGEGDEKPGEDETPGEDDEKPGEDETPGEDVEKPGEDVEIPGDNDEEPGEDIEKPGDDNDNDGNTGSTGHGGSSGKGHSGGGGGGSFTRPIVKVSEYIGDDGKKAEWVFNGRRFTKADGTHPSNEYLIIDGVIYAFYTNGYVISYDNTEYYSEDVVPAIEDIPVVSGTWDLCGWWLQYSDGSCPRNDWAHLTHDGRSDWYHFDADGWMETGWKQIGGYMYYFGTDGAMLSNTQTPDGHTVDGSGRMIR